MEKLIEIEKHINSKDNRYIFYSVYPFTTENIDGYLDYFDLDHTSLLTVGSSCDQAINASFMGCEDITIYDLSPLVKYYYYLKIASLLSLDREDFLRFLCKSKCDGRIKLNASLFSRVYFEKVKQTLRRLDYESYYIWDYLFSNYTSAEIANLFRRDITNEDSIIYCNRYLKNNKNYNQAKRVIENSIVNFIEGNVTDMKLGRKFKNIWLSNVIDYLEESDIDIMFENAIDLLLDDGKVLLSYFYYDLSNEDAIKRNPSLRKVSYTKESFNGINKSDFNNSVYIYTKKPRN